ncbi:MAG: uncharacterized membrane protein YqaE (UPF0057 family) [Pseudohongiellaceae bacterium]|jgi:uncharacterized membrane protein YqaE (UPF0057 family)
MDNKIVLILAIILPPIAVFLKSGANKNLAINIVLSLFFYIPSIVHAPWLVTKS